MIRRGITLPVVVLSDIRTRESRCVNGLHVQTFIPNPVWNGELPRGTITFTGGDTVTVEEEFAVVLDMLAMDDVDG